MFNRFRPSILGGFPAKLDYCKRRPMAPVAPFSYHPSATFA